VNDARLGAEGRGLVDLDTVKKLLAREGALFVVLVFVGFVVLPICIYLVGSAMFGAYDDGGLAGFFGDLQGELRDGEPAVVFLLLSPWLLWQLLRLTILAFRRLAPPRPQEADARREPRAGDL
jgi:hypothetical protein